MFCFLYVSAYLTIIHVIRRIISAWEKLSQFFRCKSHLCWTDVLEILWFSSLCLSDSVRLYPTKFIASLIFYGASHLSNTRISVSQGYIVGYLYALFLLYYPAMHYTVLDAIAVPTGDLSVKDIILKFIIKYINHSVLHQDWSACSLVTTERSTGDF